MDALTRTLFLAAALGVAPLHADVRNDAFARSYELEKKQDYSGAAQALEGQYVKGSYLMELRLGWLHYLQKDYSGSASYYQRAATLLPKALDARFGLANASEALGNLDLAQAQYESILAQDPGQTTAHYRLGLIHYQRADWEKAQSSLRKVLEAYPLDYDAMYTQAWVKLKLGKPEDAARLFRNLLLISPGDEKALAGLKALER